MTVPRKESEYKAPRKKPTYCTVLYTLYTYIYIYTYVHTYFIPLYYVLDYARNHALQGPVLHRIGEMPNCMVLHSGKGGLRLTSAGTQESKYHSGPYLEPQVMICRALSRPHVMSIWSYGPFGGLEATQRSTTHQFGPFWQHARSSMNRICSS